MGIIKYEACADLLGVQIQELAWLNELYSNLDSLYQNRIGTLYDRFNLDIPQRFSPEYSGHWTDEAIGAIKSACEVAAGVLNEVRLKPKPYQVRGLEEVKEQLRVIQKVVLKDMTMEFMDCACPSFCGEAR
jgi:hypothetical protein